MSGFEVIGLVLGLFPIVTQTVNMYKAVKSGRTVNSLLRKLRTEKILYHEFVRHLVAFEVAENEVQMLLTPSSDATEWKNQELQSKLKSKLGPEKCENLFEAVRDIEKLLKELNTELSDIPHGMEVLEKLTQRVKARVMTAKVSVMQASIFDRLKELSDLNTDLARLLKSQPLIPKTERPEVKLARVKFLHRDIVEPQELYETICQSYACTCAEPHFASLGFHCPCCQLPSGPAQSKKHQWNFELVFPPRNLIRRRSSLDGAVDKAISVEEKSPRPNGRSRSVSMSLESRPGQTDTTPLVKDLCSLVESVDDGDFSSQVLGMIKKKNSIYKLRINESLSDDPGRMICLEKLLHPSCRNTLLRRERMLLAFGLSKAVLQFSSTPWLDDCWSWKNFAVFTVEQSEHGELSRLFVQRGFYSAQMTAGVNAAPSVTPQSWSVYKEPVLTRLGFALIELAMGCSLCELRDREILSPDIPDGVAYPDALLDLDTAFKLVDSGRIARAESQTYEDVVRTCLRHQYRDRENAGIKGLSSGHPSFFDNVEESIITPLYEVCSHSGWEFEQVAVL